MKYILALACLILASCNILPKIALEIENELINEKSVG